MDQIYDTVTRIIDGDTLEMEVKKIADHCVFQYHSMERISLADIKAPELDEEEGIAAKKSLEFKWGNKKIRVDVLVRAPLKRIIGPVALW